jgi:hypothetical protein
MKVCSKCKVEKDEIEFYKNKSKSDGLSTYCKKCSCGASSEFRKKNSTYWNKYKEKRKLWKKDNPDSVKKFKKTYYNKHKDSIIEKAKLRYTNNHEAKKSILATSKKCREELRPSYIVWLLKQQGFTREQIDKESGLINIKKAIIQIKRFTKDNSSLSS